MFSSERREVANTRGGRVPAPKHFLFQRERRLQKGKEGRKLEKNAITSGRGGKVQFAGGGGAVKLGRQRLRT